MIIVDFSCPHTNAVLGIAILRTTKLLILLSLKSQAKNKEMALVFWGFFAGSTFNI